MDIAWITARQLLIMLLFMSCGFILSWKKLITEAGSKALATLLIYLVIPAVVIRSFLTEQTPEKTTALLISIALAVACLAISILISRLLFNKRPIDEFGAEFSNAGFLGVPLISATMGAEYVFYVAVFVALMNIMQWAYGQKRLGMEFKSWKPMLLNPLVCSLVIGLLLYFIQIPLPSIVTDSISAVTACNSPLAMILLGVYLGQTSPAHVFATRSVWETCLVRVLLVPVATLLLLTLIPVDANLRLAIFFVAIAPIGSNVSIYAQRANLDHRCATGAVCLSTLLAMVTIPLLAAAAALLWKIG